MGLFDNLFGDDKDKHQESDNSFWDEPPVSEEHFGRDKYGYFKDKEDMYSDDERFDNEDRW